jgi:hypothetical protein
MNSRKVFREFATYLQNTFPSYEVNKKFDESEIQRFEGIFLPDVFDILNKNASLFNKPRVVFNVDLSEMFLLKETEQPQIWKHVQTCIFSAFFENNVQGKIGKILGSLKTLWSESGQNTDEIDKILNDEKSQTKIEEILDYVMNSRLSSIVINIIQSVDFSDLKLETENPEDFMEMAKNIQSNPSFQKLAKQMRDMMQEKIKSGQISQNEIMQEVETIKVKVQEAFGSIFEEAIGGRKADVAPEVIMSNSPDARRARMIARMQRKVKEKRDGKNSS